MHGTFFVVKSRAIKKCNSHNLYNFKIQGTRSIENFNFLVFLFEEFVTGHSLFHELIAAKVKYKISLTSKFKAPYRKETIQGTIYTEMKLCEDSQLLSFSVYTYLSQDTLLHGLIATTRLYLRLTELQKNFRIQVVTWYHNFLKVFKFLDEFFAELFHSTSQLQQKLCAQNSPLLKGKNF